VVIVVNLARRLPFGPELTAEGRLSDDLQKAAQVEVFQIEPSYKCSLDCPGSRSIRQRRGR